MASCKKYEALIGDWEELNKHIYVCSRNSFKVYLSKKTDVILILSIMVKEKFDEIANIEKLFWFLTTWIAFVIAYFVSMMRTGFLMANTCVHK